MPKAPRPPRAAAKRKTAKKTPKPKGPKPFDLAPVIPEICGRIAAGKEYLTEILGPDRAKHLPARSTFLEGVSLDEPQGIADAYARAREAQAHAWADEAVRTGMGPPRMVEGKHDMVVDSGDVQHRRLKVDTLKWMIAKLHPKVYGERVDLTSGGEKITQPVALLPAELLLPKEGK